MFYTKSDYLLNKNDSDAIVCRSAGGVHIRLTCEDFDREAEFLRWKDWSDDDYHTTVKMGRGYDDNCIALIEASDTQFLSAEEVMLVLMEKAESDEHLAGKGQGQPHQIAVSPTANILFGWKNRSRNCQNRGCWSTPDFHFNFQRQKNCQ